MSTIMQKAVTPAFSHAYLTRGYDRIAGFVSPADSVAWADTVGSIFEAHGLGFPGSPFSSDAAFIDVIQFPATPQLRFEDAIGGTTPQERELTGGPSSTGRRSPGWGSRTSSVAWSRCTCACLRAPS